MLFTAKKVEYHFTNRLPETATVKQKSEYVLECSLSDEKPGVVWRNNGVVIEVGCKRHLPFFQPFLQCVGRLTHVIAIGQYASKSGGNMVYFYVVKLAVSSLALAETIAICQYLLRLPMEGWPG